MLVRVMDQNTQFMLTNWFYYIRNNKNKDIIMKIINKTCLFSITTNLFNTYIDEDILNAKILPLDTSNEKITETVTYF